MDNNILEDDNKHDLVQAENDIQDNVPSEPLPAKGAYTFDFDNIDENVNPFTTKTELPQTPEDQHDWSNDLNNTSVVDEKPVAENKECTGPVVASDESKVVQSTVESIGNEFDLSKDTEDNNNHPKISDEKIVESMLEKPVDVEKAVIPDSVLGTDVNNKLPQQMPETVTAGSEIQETDKQNSLDNIETETEKSREDDIPLSKGVYNIDFDKLDDSFNPFATKKEIPMSPKEIEVDVTINSNEKDDSETVAQNVKKSGSS